MIEAIVFGNVTLDVICQTVDEVPRYESVSFDRVVLSPGGCASNVAIGLAALGVSPALVCKIGQDPAAEILKKTWEKFGLSLDYVRVDPSVHTAVSVGLVDHDAQPRFVHTPGANGRLTLEDFPETLFHQDGIKSLHIAGFFVLPGLLDERLLDFLKRAHEKGWFVSLDVVNSKRYWRPEYLFRCLEEIDVFLCNKAEAIKLSGANSVEESAQRLRELGAKCVVIKVGAEGCYLHSDEVVRRVPTRPVTVIDTTGAGDAFAAGFISALVRGKGLEEACLLANECGAGVVQELGTITYWERRRGAEQ
ncbi:MAG: carbohydrate kinase family protein [Anaerolineales bacterium]|nr:carbohydrate kinase family protein [Anaerolineales bacterium]MDW8160882.1 carbohydrate kinase family protein [Anaerolineales bacterium]